MNRPFYVHTPRNIHGESLVHPSNNLEFSIRHVDRPREDVQQVGKSFKRASKKCEKMNAAHVVELWSHGAFI